MLPGKKDTFHFAIIIGFLFFPIDTSLSGNEFVDFSFAMKPIDYLDLFTFQCVYIVKFNVESTTRLL